ncbi:MAG: hypothetical protein O3A14_17515 [Cyanobacteria bacterium]|nr:hypothetical protein [Cyanobacteriota bacterium]
MIDQIKRNPGPWILGAIVVLTTAPSVVGGSDTPLGILNQLSQRAMERNGQQMALEDALRAAQDEAKIAAARYEMGCELVVASNDPGKFTVLSPGDPVRDAVRNVPLPLGMFVCDATGNTAELVPLLDAEGRPIIGFVEFLPQPEGGTVPKVVPNPEGGEIPVVGELAYTGDQEVVRRAISRQRVKATGETPQQ